MFHLPNNKVNHQLIHRVLQAITTMRQTNESATVWMVQTGYDLAARQGRLPVIPLESKGTVAVLHQAVKEQLLIQSATILVNKVLDCKGLPLVSESTVWGAVG